MKNMLKILSYIALLLTIIPAFLTLAGVIDDTTYKTLMLAGTIGWFLTAPLWIFKENNHVEN